MSTKIQNPLWEQAVIIGMTGVMGCYSTVVVSNAITGQPWEWWGDLSGIVLGGPVIVLGLGMRWYTNRTKET